MRKIVYLWCLTMMSLSMAAQIHVSDTCNWNLILNENFEGSGRGWNDRFIEIHTDGLNMNPVWRCHYKEGKSGVTLDGNRHQVSRRQNCCFNNGTYFNDNKMRIISQFGSSTPILCGTYDIPIGTNPDTGEDYYCDTIHRGLYYYSGNIETIEKFLYGYFEIRCKTPIHAGAFPAFWLFGNGMRRYEEIDIFEYMWNITIPKPTSPSPRLGYEYVFNTGMYYDRDENENRREFAHKIVNFPETMPDMSHWHTFGLEWLPGRVIWYFDGEVVNEFYDGDNIPHGPMTLKANYSIDNWALVDHNDSLSSPLWITGDTLSIDYIKVYELKTDCYEDLMVTRATQIDSINSMKGSISFQSIGNTLVFPTSTRKTIRAGQTMIDKGVEIPRGAQITFIVSPCPDSDEKRNMHKNK